MQIPSNHSIDFKIIAKDISSGKGKYGKLEGHDLYLKGKKEWIGSEKRVEQLIQAFKKMSTEERQAHFDVYKRILTNVKDSNEYSGLDRLSAAANLFFLGKPDEYLEKVVTLIKNVFQPKESVRTPAPLKFDEKMIVKKWDDGHGHRATETIERRETVPILKEQAEKQLAYLRGRPGTEEACRRLEATIAKCDESTVSWASSNYFREILRGEAMLSAKKNPGELESAIDEWESKMVNHYYPMAPAVNMRYQACETRGQKEEWMRVGVISDMSNGFVNLGLMEELSQGSNINTLRTQIAEEIIEVWKEALKNKNEKVDASAGYALRQLGFTNQEINLFKNSITWKQDIIIPQLIKQDLPRVRKAIAQATMQRREVMSRQFLQLALDHAGRISKEEAAQGMMKMLHVCILNQDSKSVDGSGWFHNEENEMRDMAAIFEQFDGKKMIADHNGPFLDHEGNIHVPPNENFKEGQEITLRTLFINQCGAGHLQNDGAQGEINRRAKARLQELQLEGLEPLLSKQKTSFSTAADTVHLGINLGCKTSTGCLSAKDRTGFVSALGTDRALKKRGFFPPSSRRRIMTEQMKEGSPEIAVIKDNTGARVMKIEPFFIEGLTKKNYNLRTFIERAIVYVRQGIEILRERRRTRELEKDRVE